MREWPPSVRLWKYASGLVLWKDHQVDPAIIVQVARGQAASQKRDLEGRAGAIGHVDHFAPAAVPAKSCAGICCGTSVRLSSTWPLAVTRSSRPSLLKSRKAIPNPSR